MISLSSLQNIEDHALNLLSNTSFLKRDSITKDSFSHAEAILDSLRKLEVASLMQKRTLICVAGLQGVGKTTLMKSFYGIDDRFMYVTLNRGERLPILITEDKVDTPQMKVERIMADDEGNYSHRSETVENPEEFVALTRGEDNSIMYLELVVPYRHTNNKSISFMLLPGFEKRNDYWDSLIDFAVNSSDAAIYVFKASSFSDGDNADYINKVWERFGKNVVYVISRSDDSKDDNAEVKQTCIETIGLKGQEDRVVCAGCYSESDQAKNEAWIKALKDALNRYVLSFDEIHNNRNEKYIYDELIKIRDHIYDIRLIIENDDTEELSNLRNDKMLRAFDRAIEKKRKELSSNIDAEFNKAADESIKKLENLFGTKTKWGTIRRTLFGSSVKDLVEARGMIEDSLDDNGVAIPEKHLLLAMQNSVHTIDSGESGTSNFNQIIDVKDDNVRVLIFDGERTSKSCADVCALIRPIEQGKEIVPLKLDDPRKTLGALAEITAYYFGLQNCNQLAKNTGVTAYEPKQMENLQGKILEGGKSTKQFVAGLAGVMGVDLIGDGTINLVSQIATELGLSFSTAGVGAAAIVGFEAARAILKDMNRIERDDYLSARQAIYSTYDAYKKKLMDNFDNCAGIVRDRIEDNQITMVGNQKKIKVEFNTLVEANMILDIIDELIEMYSTSANGLGTFRAGR